MSSFDEPPGFDPGRISGGEAEPETAEVPAPAVDLPQEPAEMLDRRVVVYWLLSGMMSFAFLAAFFGVGVAVVYYNWPDAGGYALTPAAVILGLLLTWTLISPSLAWHRWRYRVDDELLLARYGILFIEEKAIPISRLQHVDLYRGLLERFFGLTTLIVFTAGTEGAHFRLPGLSVGRARELRDQILAARGDDVV